MTYKISILISVLLLSLSCNRTGEIINQIDNDSNVIFNSAKELVASYDLCISALSDTLSSTDNLKRVFCTINMDNAKSLKTNQFPSTIELLSKGYIIKLDAENYYRIFFEHSAIEHVAGFDRYGVLYHKQEYEVKNIFSLNLNSLDTLKKISDNFYIIKVGEYAE